MLDKYLHEEFMLEALNLAKQGAGFVNPNPMVGALMVKNGSEKLRIIGRGYHKQFGGNHAEVEAIQNCIEDPKSATLYINLEPCCHTGKTGPCTEAIIKSGIKEVYIGMKDPNPLVSGKGIATLEKAHIKVHLGILEKECQKLNEVFIKWITTKTPFITIKTACTLDGKITLKKDTQTILGNEKSWQKVHEMRNQYDAILVGINTILIDNPRLTCRLNKKNCKNPKRIIVDSNLQIPLNAQIFQEEGTSIICCTDKASKDKKEEISKFKNTKVWELPANKNGQIDLKALIEKCSEENITSILIEGGGTINSAFLNAGLVDRINIIYTPRISGNKNATNLFENEILNEMNFKNISCENINGDIWFEGYL